jgi:hypothetical protein
MDPNLHKWTKKHSPDIRHETTDQKTASGKGETAEHLLARATHVPHAKVPGGQPRSLTGTPPPMTRTGICAAQPAGRETELPSWSCGFDSRRPR